MTDTATRELTDETPGPVTLAEELISLEAFYGELRQRDEGLRARLAELRAAVATSEKWLESLQDQINLKASLREQATANGLDPGPLDAQMQRLCADLTEAQEARNLQLDEVERVRLDVDSLRPESWHRNMADILDRLAKDDIAEAIVVENLNRIEHLPQVRSLISVRLGIADEHGRVGGCELRVRGVPLGRPALGEGSARFTACSLPQALRWTRIDDDPSSDPAPGAFEWKDGSDPLQPRGPDRFLGYRHADSPPIVLVERHTGRMAVDALLMSEIREPDSKKTGIRCVESILSEILAEAFTGVAGLLEPRTATEQPGLTRAVAAHILASTTAESPFPPTHEMLDSRTTHERIKTDWQRFVQAPWSARIQGPLAKLKYLVEQGERPRFWCENFANLYGFRIRTRDHTWLTGRLFIDAACPAETEVVGIEVPTKPNHWGSQESLEYGRGPQAIAGRLRIAVREHE